MRKGFIALGTLITVLLATPFLNAVALKITSADDIYHTIETVPEKQSALVLGAAAYGNRLSDILQDRVEVGIELYEAGKVKRIVMSGAPNETGAMKLYAIEKGLPVEDVIEDKEGLNTLASIKNTAKRGESMAIVSQEYHLPRALFIARHYKMDAIGVTADKHEYAKMFDFKKRELLATSKAIFDVFLGDAN